MWILITDSLALLQALDGQGGSRVLDLLRQGQMILVILYDALRMTMSIFGRFGPHKCCMRSGYPRHLPCRSGSNRREGDHALSHSSISTFPNLTLLSSPDSQPSLVLTVFISLTFSLASTVLPCTSPSSTGQGVLLSKDETTWSTKNGNSQPHPRPSASVYFYCFRRMIVDARFVLDLLDR